jgi:hypothetical protein
MYALYDVNQSLVHTYIIGGAYFYIHGIAFTTYHDDARSTVSASQRSHDVAVAGAECQLPFPPIYMYVCMYCMYVQTY